MKTLLLILFVLIIGLNYGADVKGFGYFLEGGSMKKAKLEQLPKQGTTDLFFNFFGIEIWDVSRVEPWISQANSYNIRVHIWCDSFNNGNWIYDYYRNSIRLNRYIKEIQSYARISGVYGVLLGEINYPGSSPEAVQGTAVRSFFSDRGWKSGEYLPCHCKLDLVRFLRSANHRGRLVEFFKGIHLIRRQFKIKDVDILFDSLFMDRLGDNGHITLDQEA